MLRLRISDSDPAAATVRTVIVVGAAENAEVLIAHAA